VTTQVKRLPFLDAGVDALTMAETLAVVREMVDSGQPHVHACMNAAKVVAMQSDPRLLAAIREADLISADGQSIVWAGRVLGQRFPERVAGIDLMNRLLGEAEAHQLSVFFLGSTETILHEMERVISQRYPRLIIAGMHHGYFTAEDETGIVETIRATQPQILFVGISSPRKELWLQANRERLGVPFAMGVGGSFDVLAGHVRRAPRWAQRVGLEWFFRFLQEPGRLWRRYLLGNATFVWLVIRGIGRR
jgi:N-acetylglucosaminyldiphosphoundecaprenol N-acetyl-beta-D-mannosaminyltransferase